MKRSGPNCLSVIKDNVSLQSYKTWFEPIKPVKLKDSVLTIQVPSQFFYEWLEEHYITLLKKTIKKELGSDGKLEYSIIMDNNLTSSKPYSVRIPTSNTAAVKNPSVSMPIEIGEKTIKNPFHHPRIEKGSGGFAVESELFVRHIHRRRFKPLGTVQQDMQSQRNLVAQLLIHC